jgi:hypothetical protein
MKSVRVPYETRWRPSREIQLIMFTQSGAEPIRWYISAWCRCKITGIYITLDKNNCFSRLCRCKKGPIFFSIVMYILHMVMQIYIVKQWSSTVTLSFPTSLPVWARPLAKLHQIHPTGNRPSIAPSSPRPDSSHILGWLEMRVHLGENPKPAGPVPADSGSPLPSPSIYGVVECRWPPICHPRAPARPAPSGLDGSLTMCVYELISVQDDDELFL